MPTFAFERGDKPLGDGCAQRAGHLSAKTEVLVGRIKLEQSLDRLLRIGRVQRSEDIVPCFRRRKCRVERFGVPHFPNQNDVGILS